MQTVQVDCDHGLQWSMQKFAYFGRIFLIGYSIFRGESPLLMRNIQVNFGDIFSETSKSSAFWDMGVDSNLKWLPLPSLDEAGELDGTILGPIQKYVLSSLNLSLRIGFIIHVYTTIVNLITFCEWRNNHI